MAGATLSSPFADQVRSEARFGSSAIDIAMASQDAVHRALRPIVARNGVEILDYDARAGIDRSEIIKHRFLLIELWKDSCGGECCLACGSLMAV